MAGDKAAMDQYMQALEKEAVRAVLPPGLEDDKLKDLKYDLHWCLTKNDYRFTIGGILLGGTLSLLAGTMKPFMVAAILAPAADWAYGRHMCADYEAAYINYKKQLREEHRKQVDEVKQRLHAATGRTS